MKHFDDEFAALQARMQAMSDNAKSMLRLASRRLEATGLELHEEIIEMEDELDQTQVEIDNEAVRLMTVYSPVASDLRGLIVVMHVTSQLERVGDQALNIFECMNLMDQKTSRPDMSDVVEMAKLVEGMLTDSLGSYFERDVDLARRVWAQDDLVDAQNAQITKKWLSDALLRDVLDGSEDVADVLALILLARHFERIADQSTNICKEVVYLVEGQDVRHTDQV